MSYFGSREFIEDMKRAGQQRAGYASLTAVCAFCSGPWTVTHSCEGQPQPVVPWWLCPNDPPCPHASVLHDISERDDLVPRCCADDCRCGEGTAITKGSAG